MTEPEQAPQVSWKVLEHGAVVVTADGSEAAKVVEVAGDRALDIFSGLVVTLGPLDGKRYLPAEHVVAIWPRRVQVDLTRVEIEGLSPYQEPVVKRLPKESFFKRLRRRLFG